MKLIAALVSMLVASSAMAQMTEDQITNSPPDQVLPSAIFQFGRTNYFHGLVDERCIYDYPGRVASDDARLRGLADRLNRYFGRKALDVDKPQSPVSGNAGRSCDEVTLQSYEMKLTELALWADRADALKVQMPPPTGSPR